MQVRHLSVFVGVLALTAAAQAFAQGQEVQSREGGPEPLVPVYMEYEGVKGETTSPPPPPPPPPNAPPAEPGVQSQQSPQPGLIVPAIQRAQEQQQEGAPAEGAAQPRRRGGFAFSVGGLTVGSGGVSVAVGDVNGDGASARRTSERGSR